MIRFVVANQRGGIGKTTTSLNLGWCFAEKGLRTLIVDTDPQGSVSTLLGLRPVHELFHFLIERIALSECVTNARHPNLDVLASSRHTNKAEDMISTQMGREFAFEHAFSGSADAYDAIIIDCAPSVGLFQACAMLYARKVLIPVGMESLSVQGASAAMQAAASLNDIFRLPDPVVPVGILPVSVDRRLQMTTTVLNTLPLIADRHGIRVLRAIRTDTAVPKAGRDRKHLAEFDAKSKALEDYRGVAEEILEMLNHNAAANVQTTA